MLRVSVTSGGFWWHMWYILYIDGLVQEKRNSIANALELRFSCTNPLISTLRMPWPSVSRFELLQQRSTGTLILYHFVESKTAITADPMVMIRRLTSQVIMTGQFEHPGLYIRNSFSISFIVLQKSFSLSKILHITIIFFTCTNSFTVGYVQNFASDT